MLSLLLIIKLFASQANPEYYVSNIKGKVFMAASHEALKIGDKVHLNEQLLFSSLSDRVAVINPERGRFVIQKNQLTGPHTQSELLIKIGDHLVPATKSVVLAGRAPVNSKSDLAAWLRNLSKQQNDTLANFLFTDSIKFLLSSKSFPNPTTRFFFIRYIYQNEQINKRLAFRSDEPSKRVLVIDRGIFSIDGQTVKPQSLTPIQLFYYDSERGESETIGKMALHVVDPIELQQEIQVLRRQLRVYYRGKSDADELVKKEIMAQLNEEYGFVDSIND